MKTIYLPLLLLALVAGCATTSAPSSDVSPAIDVIGPELKAYIEKDEVILPETRLEILSALDVVNGVLATNDSIDLVGFSQQLLLIGKAHNAYVENDSTLTEDQKRIRLRTSELLIRLVREAGG